MGVYNDKKFLTEYYDGTQEYMKIRISYGALTLSRNSTAKYLIFFRSAIFMCMCNGNKILHLFLYNPNIVESGWITQSIHKTRKGAEQALEEHKKEVIEECNMLGCQPDEVMKCQDWRICEFELLD